MEEEISLREIIETIWNGKIVIIGITLAAMIIAAILSFFVIAPTYEAVSTVRVMNNNNESKDTNEMLTTFAESVKGDVSINRIADKLGIDTNERSINSIRNSIDVQPVKDTSMIRVKVTGEDPEMITRISNAVVFELGARIEISDRSVEIVNSKNRVLRMEDSLIIQQTELLQTQQQLEQTPEKLFTKQSVADVPYLQSIVEQSEGLGGIEAGQLTLTTETINPLYTSLTARITEATINISKLIEEKAIIEQSIDQHLEIINELESQNYEQRLQANDSERMLDGYVAVSVSPAIKPSDPIAPRKIMNVAIAAVVGVMLSLLLVFFNHYWKSSETSVTSNNDGLAI